MGRPVVADYETQVFWTSEVEEAFDGNVASSSALLELVDARS